MNVVSNFDISPSFALAATSRGNYIELLHYGRIAVQTDRGQSFGIGDIATPLPMRSTAKPFLLLPLLRQKDNSITNERIALFASSHNGERYHAQLLAQTMQDWNIDNASINLGRSPDSHTNPAAHSKEPTSISEKFLKNTCSGKHIAVMRLAQHLSQPISTYSDQQGPALTSIRTALREIVHRVDHQLAGEAVDGCGLPTYAVSLQTIAALYYELLHDTKELACIRAAMLRHPYAVAGRDRLVTTLLRQKVIAKDGFGGLFAIALRLPARSIAIVIKVDSGTDAIAEQTAAELLKMLTGEAIDIPSRYLSGTVHNQLGEPVGQTIVNSRILRDLLRQCEDKI